jgi:cysteine desulfurase NifS
LVFNSGARVTTDFRSQFHGIPGLVKQRPEPTVTIHTQDAAARGIQHGDAVQVQSRRGQVTMRALVTDDIAPGCVDANMGGGGPLGPKAWQECNINELTDLKYDSISGFPVYKALLCDVRKAHGSGAVAMDSGEVCSSWVEAASVRAAGASSDRKDRIYLDHNATTRTDPEVLDAMNAHMGQLYGNPSSIYEEGREAKTALEGARRRLAALLNCTARRIAFTGGGSESNNLVLKGMALAPGNHPRHIITTSIEHPSVLRTCQWLQELGFQVSFLPADRHGMVNPTDLENIVGEDTLLVSVMAANNETGTIQPLARLAEIAHRHGVPFHTDAVQAVGKIPVDVEDLGVDFLTLSGHKLHGPKGVGALYMRKDMALEPLVHGGGQEQGMRAGTENTIGIVGLGKAAELAQGRLQDMAARVLGLRERLWAGIRRTVPQARLNGHPAQRLPNTLNVTLPGIRGESLVLALDQKGVSFSSGSACRSGSASPSHALLAMGLSEEEAHCALRFSLGVGTTEKQIDDALDFMGQVIRGSTASVRFAPCR